MQDYPILFVMPGACSIGPHIALELLQIPYSICITNPEMRQSQDYRNINPSGKVAALKDGKVSLGENIAVLLYLADTYDNDNKFFFKIKSEERTKAYQWLSFINSAHEKFIPNFFAERYLGEPINDETGMKFKEISYQSLLTSLTIINTHLDKNNGFFIGSALSLIDAQAFAILRWSRKHKIKNELIDLSQFQQIEKFLNNMEKLEAVQNALLISDNRAHEVNNSKFIAYNCSLI